MGETRRFRPFADRRKTAVFDPLETFISPPAPA
jgi:hypothetical protein